MNDIVERASRYVGRADQGVACGHITELVAEIERLRAENQRYRLAIDTIFTAAKACRDEQSEKSK